MAGLTLAMAMTVGTLRGHEVDSEAGAKIQLALLLDTSNSMDGLIQQAKSQLWSIVNNFNGAKKDDEVAFVEVALYEYGNNALSAESYWIRQVLPFTRDLDEVSRQLFELRTNGGDEYCGAVIRRAVEQLDWDEEGDSFKAVFIAGNEPFHQGSIDPGSACREAMAKSIIVNTVHCGSEREGENSGWKSGALVTGGSYAFIDQNKSVVSIECPQDKLIIELNTKLNHTYLYFGSKGRERAQNQLAQDANSIAMGNAACLSRVATKASANYWNGHWDLVDACDSEGFNWDDHKEEELPEALRGKSTEEKEAHVAALKKERLTIQKRIRELNAERSAWLKEEMQRRGMSNSGTLGEEASEALRKQAERAGFSLRSDAR